MIRILAVVLFAAVAHGMLLRPIPPQVAMDWDRSHSVVDGKIVGGEDADISDAPYQVAMLRNLAGGSFFQSCGGSIIRADVVSSAAHCSGSTTASQWSIRAGSTFSLSGGQVVPVGRILNHPQYNSATIANDIALYFLAGSVSINGVTTRLVPLPAQGQAVADNSPAFVTGWGSIREGGGTVPNLQKVTIPIVNQQVCANAYAPTVVSADMICAGHIATGGQDACQGDSGGPLTVNGVLIGITSWGRGCARPGFPGVWVRVPHFRNWIDNEM